jgi:gas vesicle protein
MAEKSGNFLGGFILGTIAGSALGIILGSKLNKILDPDQTTSPDDESSMPITSEEIANRTKRGLEQKIAQLNEAIDAVSQELSTESNGKVSFQSPHKSPQIEKL